MGNDHIYKFKKAFKTRKHVKTTFWSVVGGDLDTAQKNVCLTYSNIHFLSTRIISITITIRFISITICLPRQIRPSIRLRDLAKRGPVSTSRARQILAISRLYIVTVVEAVRICFRIPYPLARE